MNLIRCTRREPCRICSKPDWCGYNEHGAGCMRVESAIPMRNGGFWHPNNGQGNGTRVVYRPARAPVQMVAIDVGKLLADWRARSAGELEPFSATLGVSQDALQSLGCVYAPEHRALAFPMYDAKRALTGIRLRNDRGKKWCVTGSKQGLFLPLRQKLDGRLTAPDGKPATATDAGKGNTLLIVEGPTDAAAAIDLGFDVIGRPMNVGCEEMVRECSREHSAVFIVADNDPRPCPLCHGDGCHACEDGVMQPGKRGAEKLQKLIPRSRIVTLPTKDLRAFKNAGGTAAILNGILAAVV